MRSSPLLAAYKIEQVARLASEIQEMWQRMLIEAVSPNDQANKTKLEKYISKWCLMQGKRRKIPFFNESEQSIIKRDATM